MIGMLPFAAACLCYDIGFAVGFLGTFLSRPHRVDLSCARRVLRYLGGFPLVVRYGSASSVKFDCYTDSKWAGDFGDRMSIVVYNLPSMAST